jgi:hypothetical protein
MKKIRIILMAAVVLITACQKKEINGFQGTANVFFTVNSWDSVLYTFALHPERKTDTVWVPVSISGNRMDRDRAYSVKVIDSLTTAVVNKHYEPLKEQYVMPAGTGFQYLPVILYNTDSNMRKRPFTLKLRVVPTADFNTDINDQVTARVVFSSRLEKPVWWIDTPGGDYSLVKHQLFRLAATTEEVSMNNQNAPIWVYYTSRLQALLISPQTWIDNNPNKGYTLQPRADGSGNQDFYNIQTPEVKFRYEKDPNSGIFYFIDENNGQVK